ncbi:NAD(P)/FAD-dependent oxidoreductase [Marilutibacter alkalisoli]|uniref:NAD(P)/FAD-dependent oxidoreductase n=1 Tax=Marilutibacter alkalisoli TaxID=2591633 RepID=UPI001FC9DA4D|nr:FAD-binding oxidoreductase [Lysobacter alkalisoli]
MSRPVLSGRTDARVCVVGGGFAGLNTGLGLAERGVDDVVLLDAREIGFGASGRNGGFVFGGYSRDEAALLRDLGPERARELYAGTTAAVGQIRERIRRHAIDCDAVDGGVIWANWFRDPQPLRERQRLLAETYGVEWQWLTRERLRERLLTDRYHAGLFEPHAFHFHPLKYAQGIARVAASSGVRIHERSPAIGLSRDGAGWVVRTPDGEVRAETVVLACGGYLAGLVGRVDAGVLPIATYVMVTEPLGDRLDDAMRTNAAVYDTRFAFDYYRALPDTRLLWGGRVSILDRPPEAVKRLLYRDLLKVFPQLGGVRIDHAWSGLMSYARHQMPQIGRIDEGLWLAQAFGGHGVAPTTHAGEVVASAIAEGDERWKMFADYGLVSAMKPAGLIGAQLSYWWAEARDAWKDWMERLGGR